MSIRTVPLTWSDPALEPRVLAIAARFHLPVAPSASSHDLMLVLTPDRLELRCGDMSGGCDFLAGPLAHRIRANTHNRFRGESLVKAMPSSSAVVCTGFAVRGASLLSSSLSLRA
jgi:hypothetical protein